MCIYIYIDIHTYIPTFNHTYIETLSVSVNDPCVLPVLGIHTGHSQNSHFLRHTKRPTTTKREKHKNNRTKQHQQKQSPRGDPTQKHGEPTTKTQSRRRVPSNQRKNKTKHTTSPRRSEAKTQQNNTNNTNKLVSLVFLVDVRSYCWWFLCFLFWTSSGICCVLNLNLVLPFDCFGFQYSPGCCGFLVLVSLVLLVLDLLGVFVFVGSSGVFGYFASVGCFALALLWDCVLFWLCCCFHSWFFCFGSPLGLCFLLFFFFLFWFPCLGDFEIGFLAVE